MARKKAGKKTAGRAPGVAPSADPCDDGLPEIVPSVVLVPRGSTVRLRIVVCGSQAAAAANLEGRLLFSQMIADDFVSPIQLPSVPGVYFLLWMLNPLEAEWRVQTEVAMDEPSSSGTARPTTAPFPARDGPCTCG